MGDINLLKILGEMSTRGGKNQCAQIAAVISLAQPSISHHIKTLIEAGLIIPEKKKKLFLFVKRISDKEL